METHEIVSHADWVAARKELLLKEKDLSKLRDSVSAARRALPWEKVDKTYLFDTDGAKRSLEELFDQRSQLVIYHFMLDPAWDEGCSGCSFVADHIDGANMHLRHHDVTLLVVSRAPLPKIQAYQKRMGWQFPWVSSYGSDFNYDFQVTSDETIVPVEYNYQTKAELLLAGQPWFTEGEHHGLSVFFKDTAGIVFHTYSAYARGTDILIGAYNYLDHTPKGRNETRSFDWVRRHDRYEADPAG